MGIAEGVAWLIWQVLKVGGILCIAFFIFLILHMLSEIFFGD